MAWVGGERLEPEDETRQALLAEHGVVGVGRRHGSTGLQKQTPDCKLSLAAAPIFLSRTTIREEHSSLGGGLQAHSPEHSIP